MTLFIKTYIEKRKNIHINILCKFRSLNDHFLPQAKIVVIYNRLTGGFTDGIKYEGSCHIFLQHKEVWEQL